jgi:small-conductance mechanosensitive channel
MIEPLSNTALNNSVPGSIAIGILGLIIAFSASKFIPHLRSTGLLPLMARAAVFFGRLIAILFGITALLGALPSSLDPAIPYMIIAIGLTIGWSSKELIQDLSAGAVLLIERKIRIGVRLTSEHHSGVVLQLGFRAVYLGTGQGGITTVPNRVLTSSPFSLDPVSDPPVTVRLRIVSPITPSDVHNDLCSMALLSPFVAPSYRPTVVQSAENAEMWDVTCRLLRTRHAHRFKGAMELLIRRYIESPKADKGEEV